MNKKENQKLLQNQQKYQPILSKLQVRFPKLKIDHKKYQSPNQSPQINRQNRQNLLLKKNSYSTSQDETKQQTKMQYSSQNTLEKLLQQLQDHSKKLHNVVYNQSPVKKQPQNQHRLYNKNEQTSFQNSCFHNEYLIKDIPKKNQQISNKFYKNQNFQQVQQKNKYKQINQKYQIKTSKQIVSQWRIEKLIQKNLMGVHWENKFATKFKESKKFAFQLLKFQFCIQNGILATQSKMQEPIKYEKILQNVGVGFNKIVMVFRYKVLTKLRDSLIKMKFYNDISGVFAKSNQTTGSNKNMFTSFFQMSDNHITKQLKQINQAYQPILSNKSIIKQKPTNIQIQQMKEIKNNQKSRSKLLQSNSNSQLSINNSKISKISSREKQSKLKSKNQEYQFSNQDNLNEYKQSKNIQNLALSQKSIQKANNQYNFGTPIKNINLITTPKKDQMRIYPFIQAKQKKAIVLDRNQKKQITSQSQQIETHKAGSYFNNQVEQTRHNQINLNLQNKRHIGRSMDQKVLQRNSRPFSRQMHPFITFNKNEQNLCNPSTIRPINMRIFNESNTFQCKSNQVQYRQNYGNNIHNVPSNYFENRNIIQIRNIPNIQTKQKNYQNDNKNRIQRCYSQQSIPFRQQQKIIKTQKNIAAYPFNQVLIQATKQSGINFNQTQNNFIKKEPNIMNRFQSRISSSNQNRLPVIFQNYPSQANKIQIQGKHSRSLSQNCLKNIQPLSYQINQQSKIVYQPQRIVYQRQRQSSVDSYSRLLKQPFIKIQKHQIKNNVIHSRPIQSSQYFAQKRQIKNVKNHQPCVVIRQNPYNFRAMY